MAVRYWGNLFAAIGPISETRDEIFTSRLAVWMQVDEKSDVIKLTDFEEVPLQNSDVFIPRDIGLDSRVFEIAFNEKNHTLTVQLVNDDGKTISPRRAEAAIRAALEAGSKDLVQEINVQIIPESDLIEKIVSLPELKVIEIHLLRPNPDDLDDEANELLESELTDQHARAIVKTIQKAPGFDTIILNARNILLARLAALNGYVSGKGKDSNGKPVLVSTKDHPMIIQAEVEERLINDFGFAQMVA